MQRSKLPSKRLLRTLNAQTLPDDNTLQPILQIGDPMYYMQRSRELILLAESESKTPKLREAHLKMAAQLILLARVALQPEPKPKKQPWQEGIQGEAESQKTP